MSNMAELAEKEVIRSEILKICSEAAPAGASVQVLRAGLRKMGFLCGETEVEKQIFYLEGKGFLTTQRIHNEQLDIRRTIASITSLGTDFLEGNAAASGIANG